MRLGLRLLDLPSELLLEIFRRLDYRALLYCCSVCQVFKKIVSGYVELQYLIELGADGLVDGPSNMLTHSDRLAMLLDRRRAWARLEWKRRVAVSMPGTCQAYELVGGVFAKTVGDGSHGSRHFIASWLPSARTVGHQLERADVGLLTRDFAIDPSQDLIAFVQADENSTATHDKINIHFRTISSNISHPRAHVPLVHCDTSSMITTAFIQIVDDVIGIFVWAQTEGPRFLIWNWKDGTLLIDHSASDLPPNTWDFSFLSSRAYMLASCARQGSIEVYSFEPKPTSTTGMGSTCSSHVASLALPELQDDIGVAILSTHTGPFYARCPPGKAFTTSPDSRISRIHAVSVQYFGIRDFHPRYCFFVHNRTLLSYVDMDRAPGNVIRVPWEEWGTDHTRFLPHHTPFQWLRYVQGQRVITPPHLHDGKRIIQVFDFNVHASRRHAHYNRLYRDDNTSVGLVCNKIVTHASHIPGGNLFKKPVVTRLPYHVVSREDSQAYSGFMIDEERIIGLKTDTFAEGDMEDIHVFTF